MHENRETSETPAAQPGRRSAGEGLSHKARAYVYEESHSGIVPMNHSNKDGKLSAESGEGRPLIKENAGQPNTYPTQSGKGVSQGLGRGMPNVCPRSIVELNQSLGRSGGGIVRVRFRSFWRDFGGGWV
jgi:hypothetical protein